MLSSITETTITTLSIFSLILIGGAIKGVLMAIRSPLMVDWFAESVAAQLELDRERLVEQRRIEAHVNRWAFIKSGHRCWCSHCATARTNRINVLATQIISEYKATGFIDYYGKIEEMNALNVDNCDNANWAVLDVAIETCN